MKTQELIHIGSRQNVTPKQILKLKAEGNYTSVYLDDGGQVLSATTLGTIEKRLTDSFFRVNRSTIINLSHLKRFKVHFHKSKGNSLQKTNAQDIFLSRRRVAAFQAFVNT